MDLSDFVPQPGAEDATASWLQGEVEETGLVRVIFGQRFPEKATAAKLVQYNNINSFKAV